MATKRARYGPDGGTDHFGSNVQPYVEITHQVAPYEETAWTHQIPQNSLCLYRTVDRDFVKGFRNLHATDQYTHTLTLAHVNGIICQKFIQMANAWIKEQWTPGGPMKRLDEIDYQRVMEEIYDTWKFAGVCITPPRKEDETMNYTRLERELVLRIRGDVPASNVFGPTVHGGDHCFLVLKFVESRFANPQFTFSGRQSLRCDAFQSASPKRYVPTFVPMHFSTMEIPHKMREFKVFDKTLRGMPVYVGRCVYNSKFDGKLLKQKTFTPFVNALEIQNDIDLLVFAS
jgi:hypothetical protein